jgi:hypothetical protein
MFDPTPGQDGRATAVYASRQAPALRRQAKRPVPRRPDRRCVAHALWLAELRRLVRGRVRAMSGAGPTPATPLQARPGRARCNLRSYGDERAAWGGACAQQRRGGARAQRQGRRRGARQIGGRACNPCDGEPHAPGHLGRFRHDAPALKRARPTPAVRGGRDAAGDAGRADERPGREGPPGVRPATVTGHAGRRLARADGRMARGTRVGPVVSPDPRPSGIPLRAYHASRPQTAATPGGGRC